MTVALNPARLFAVLNHHGVRYVVIGGMAVELHQVPVERTDVPVASLEDVARSKQAAGRAKDFEKLPAIERVLRERRTHP